MADFTALNFTQIISPGGGGAPGVTAGQGAPLSANPLASSGLLGGDAAAGANAPPTDIFTFLLSQNNALPKQEKFTALGKNLPVKDADASKPQEKKTDNSLDALQAILANLAVQQSAPVAAPTDTVSGSAGEDTIVADTQALTQNTTQTPAVVVDVLQTDDEAPVTPAATTPKDISANQLLQKQSSLLAQAQQLFKNTVAANASDAATTDQLAQNKSDALSQIQNLLSNAAYAKRSVAQSQALNTIQDNKAAVSTLDQGNTLQALQDKTLNAYKATTALSQPEVGSTLNTSDVDAAKNAPALPVQQVVNKVSDKVPVSSNDIIVNLPPVKDDVPQTVNQALARLKNVTAPTPAPQTPVVDTKTVALNTNAAALPQPVTVKPAPSPPSDSNDKKTSDTTDTTVQNTAVNTVTPQAVPQVNQQQNASQQFSQKKPETVQAIKATDEKPDVDLVPLTHPVAHKAPVDTTPAQDFANQLSKTIASPAEQVAMKIAHLPSGKQNITVQLDPADLGKVDVKLTWGNDGHAHISIAAENKDTLKMLQNDMGALQRSLADSGIKADASNLQFSMRGQDSFAGQFAQGNQQQRNDGGNNAQQQSSDIDLKQTVESASIAARYVNLNNLIDLHV